VTGVGGAVRRPAAAAGHVVTLILVGVAAAWALTSCGPGTTGRRLAGRLPPRPADCNLELLTGWSARPYFTLGVIEAGAFHRGRLPATPPALLRLVREKACKMGGDAVIIRPNAGGRYDQATVVAFLPLPSASKRSAAGAPK
jgi:hypothetical protein